MSVVKTVPHDEIRENSPCLERIGKGVRGSETRIQK
jgi:hypothetical protein